MMNPEIKARWTAWLRANADKQTRERLNRVTSDHDDYPVGFCCLGGLCELAVQDGVISSEVTRRKEAFNDHGEIVGYGSAPKCSSDLLDNWSVTTLPLAVREWAGLRDVDPAVRTTVHPDTGERMYGLTELNDDHGYNFHQIADLIDAQL